MQKIRNINSIHVFSVVSEQKNVTKAAHKLSISQSSVSYHIKKLESDLSVALFRRTSNGLELTEDGTLLAEHVSLGLGYIETGLEKISNRSGSVRAALLPMFSSRWLSSRLGSLLEASPALRLSIHNHNNTFAKMENPENFADLGIQWGRGNWDAFETVKLWPEKLVVVCSPDYLRAHPIADLSDIKRCTILHVDDERMWSEWFTENNIEPSVSQSQMMLQDRHFQLSSTVNGLGVSLFASWLVKSELKSGELVEPFKRGFDTSFAYHLISPNKSILSVQAKSFWNWIVDQATDRGT